MFAGLNPPAAVANFIFSSAAALSYACSKSVVLKT